MRECDRSPRREGDRTERVIVTSEIGERRRERYAKAEREKEGARESVIVPRG